MKVSVTGHRPSHIGGYEPCEWHRAIRRHMRDLLVPLKERHKDLILVSGGALGIDQWWMAVGHHLNIPVLAILPFHGFEKRWPKQSQDDFKKLLDRCSGVLYTVDGESPSTKKDVVHALLKRDAMLVDTCDLLVAYWNGSKGGTSYTISLARKANKDLLIFNPKEIYEKDNTRVTFTS